MEGVVPYVILRSYYIYICTYCVKLSPHEYLMIIKEKFYAGKEGSNIFSRKEKKFAMAYLVCKIWVH